MGETDFELIAELESMAEDPLGFVDYAYQWDKGELKGRYGPRDWQEKIWADIGEALRAPPNADGSRIIRWAVASGHGIGKSAWMSMTRDWGQSTAVDTKVVITAGTEPQLKTKTWPEMAKWHRLSIAGPLFDFKATSVNAKDPRHSDEWRADMIPWNDQRPEAFQGLHNLGKRLIILFDEASAIASSIWEATSGALTDADTDIIWIAFGNPTRRDGEFAQCFEEDSGWKTMNIDSRDVEGTNKEYLEEQVKRYGEDSDRTRVRVKGQFPRQGMMTFMVEEDIRTCMRNMDPPVHMEQPLIMGADVARFGDDKSVILFRRGPDASTLPMQKYAGIDTMTFAARIIEAIRRYEPDGVFIDEGGVGGGVVDRVRSLGYHVVGVNFGKGSDRGVQFETGIAGERYGNKRAEMWGSMREWMRKEGSSLETDPETLKGMSAVEFGYNRREEIILESKKDMKRRGLESPDEADALALTFAYPVVGAKLAAKYSESDKAKCEWDPFANL